MNLGNVTNLDNLASKRASSFFFPKTDTRSISLTVSSRFSSQLNTITQISQTKLDVPSLNGGVLVKNPYVWSSICLLYTSPSPRDRQKSRMPSSA